MVSLVFFAMTEGFDLENCPGIEPTAQAAWGRPALGRPDERKTAPNH